MLDRGEDADMVELGGMMDRDDVRARIADYLNERMRAVSKSTRDDTSQLRELRDTPAVGSGAPKIDFFAKQKEFRMKKKVDDLEKKLEVVSKASKEAKVEMQAKILETGERADTMEREVRRVQMQYDTLVPQIKAFDSLKVSHEEVLVIKGELERSLKETSDNLAAKTGEFKNLSTDLFKCNIKLKNTTRDYEDLQKRAGATTIELKDVKKERKKLEEAIKAGEAREQERLDGMEDEGTQFSPELAECGSQTDFVGREVSLRQSNGVQGFPGKMWGRTVTTIAFKDRTEAAVDLLRGEQAMLGTGLPAIGSMSMSMSMTSNWGGGPETLTSNRDISRVLRSAGGGRPGSRQLSKTSR
jgi:hypothetical protein